MRVVSWLLLSGLVTAELTFEVSHSYTESLSNVVWTPLQTSKKDRSSSLLDGRLDVEADTELRILHITDSHVSRFDEDPPHTHRMFDAMKTIEDKESRQPKRPCDQLVSLFQKAQELKVDLIALGGDIINYPSEKEVAWVLQQLQEAAGGIPFLYTAGNHDWHLENTQEPRYDSSRLPQLTSTLKPFFDRSVGSSHNGLYGHYQTKGIDILWFDNSNYQINAEQLAFAEEHLSKSVKQAPPLVLLLHIPLAFPGLDLPPKEVCGHGAWGTRSDEMANVEGRPPWPAQNEASTYSFLELVRRHSAPHGRILALLTGHVHKDFTKTVQSQPVMPNLIALSCDHTHPHCVQGSFFERHQRFLETSSRETPSYAKGAVQYNTLDAAEGGYRLLKINHA